MNKKNIKNKTILVMRIGNIGDVLMVTPLLRELRMRYPQATIDMLASPHGEFIVEDNPYIDNVYIYRKNKKWWLRFQNNLLIRKLYKNNYDLIFSLETGQEYVDLTRRLINKNTRSIGFTTEKSKNFLTHHFSCQYDKHTIDNYFEMIDLFCTDVSTQSKERDYRLDLFFSPENIKEIEKSCSIDFELMDKYVVVHMNCTCTWPNRAIPSDLVKELIPYFQKKGFHVFLTGASDEKQQIDDLINSLEFSENVTSYVGKPLKLVSFLISKSKFVFSPDTGVMHIASAFQIPLVALFGPSDPHHTGPIGSKSSRIARHDFPCGPCHYYPEYRLEEKKDCLSGDHPPCMKAYDSREVIGYIESLL